MLNEKYIPTYNIAWQIAPSNDYVYILDIRSEEFYKFDGSAMVIWNTIIETGMKKDCIDNLCKIYSISSDEATDDVEDFLCQLIDLGFIRKEES